MDHFDAARALFDPTSLVGAAIIGALIFGVASAVALLIRRSTRRLAQRLSDGTVLQYVGMFAQLLVYLIGLVLYAHLIPALREVGTALLAGASIVSVVVGLAAQDTLGNLIAGLSLVLSKAIRVGDEVRFYSPVGVIAAKVRVISLGFTRLTDKDGNEVVVPNSVIMSGAIVRVGREPEPQAQHGG